ncbi:MAG: hypothetical protein P4L33_17410 [Capsulimonadaceae bacterium]|nr:hypothetical protein [Capsulimonadaceae bacterium]
MTELEDLQSRLRRLETQLTEMDREQSRLVWRMRVGVAVAFGLAAFAITASCVRSADTPGVVTARSLNIVDDKGRPMVTLSSNDQGGTLSINATNGQIRVRQALGKLGQGELVMTGKNDTKLITLSADDDGGLVRVGGNDGETRVLVACQTNEPNAGLINIRDGHGKERVNIGSDINGGQITVGNDGETIMSRVGSDKRGGFYYSYGLDHKAHIVMATGEGNVGLLNTRDGNGNNRVILGYDNQGGQVIVNGADSKPRAGLLVGDNGAGVVATYDKNGNLPAAH